MISTIGTTGNATTLVNLPSGGLYRLAYWLENAGGQINSWRAIISAVDGSFSPIVLDALSNSQAFDRTYRELPFYVPRRTNLISLGFEARQVRLIPWLLPLLLITVGAEVVKACIFPQPYASSIHKATLSSILGHPHEDDLRSKDNETQLDGTSVVDIQVWQPWRV